MTASPVQARALARVKRLPELQALMLSQLEKGRAEYGGPIDDCGYSRPRLLEETGREAADLVVYLEALTCPADVMRGVLLACSWLEGELR